MSSRLLQPEDPHPVEQVSWRQVSRLSKAPPAAAPVTLAEGAIERLQREWEQRVAEARSAGAQDGEAAGRSRAAAEVQSTLERLAKTIEEVAALRSRLRREAEADTVKL